MCTTCGCDGPSFPERAPPPKDVRGAPSVVRIELDLLAENDAVAAETRRVLDLHHIRMIDVIGGPGTGKTALIEAAIPHLVRARRPVVVLEGDPTTDLDAQRIRRTGATAAQLNTGTGCHLDATLVREGLGKARPPPASLVLVENVGNLVCPALFDIGEAAKVVLMSVAEGDDKPLKYVHAFRAAQAFVLTKTDLLPHVAFDVDRCIARALEVNSGLRIFRASAKKGDGIRAFCDWMTAGLP